MGLLQWFTTKKPVELSVAVGSAVATSQTTVDSEAWMSPMYIPRNRLQRLDLFQKAYLEVSLINQAIDALVLLSNGDLLGNSGDAAVDSFVLRLLKEINFSAVLDKSLRQFFTYGYSLEEVVFDSSFREIVRIANVDSRTVYVRKNRQGQIDAYLQIPQTAWMLAGRSPRDKIVNHAINIPKDRVLYSCRSPLTDNPYGVSVIQSLLLSGLPRTLTKMQKGAGIIYEKMAAQPQHWNLDPTKSGAKNPTAKESETFLAKLKRAIGIRGFHDDIYTVGTVTNTPLYAGSTKDLSKDQQYVREEVLAGLGLVGELFGYSSTDSGGISQSREKLAIMLDKIARVRKQREHEINTVLMPLIQDVYNLSVMPAIRFSHSRIVDAKLDAERFSIIIVYCQQLLRMGLASPEYISEILELPGVYDEAKLEEWLASSAESAEPTNEVRQKNNQIAEESAVIE